MHADSLHLSDHAIPAGETAITDAVAAQVKERARVVALNSYDILNTPAEDVFDEFARMAASIVGTPIALVSLVDGHRQWFKAKVGLDVCETPRDVAFCAHAIGSTGVFVVPDAQLDPRFSHNPLVTGGPKIRFYAGAPLINSEGHALGTLCVIDYVPHEITLEQQCALQMLSRHVMAQLELRRRLTEFTLCSKSRQHEIKALRRAIDTAEFVLHYQPKVDMRTRCIVGLEALIRWNRPGQGLVSPASFVPLLEETGLIMEIGNWVLQQAMRDFRDWTALGLRVPSIAVNVSPHQLRHPDFVAQLRNALGAPDRVRAALDLEITEGVLLENAQEVIETLNRVRHMGVQVAIDDFGTGYSSLRYLAHLPIDTLKIDRYFIDAMTDDADDMAIVSSIITLAHGLDLNVVAEGVETEEQHKMLRLLRCDQMQGYLFGRPVAKRDLQQILTLEAEAAAQRSLRSLDPAKQEFPERRLSRGRPAGRD